MKKLFLLLFFVCNIMIAQEGYCQMMEDNDLSFFEEQGLERREGFIRGTKILTVSGYKEIEKLTLQDLLVGKDSDQEIIDIRTYYTNKDWYYELTTEHHGFYTYPEEWVHNADIVITAGAGFFVVGVVEVANFFAMLSGILIPLSLYMVQSYFSKHHMMPEYKSQVFEDHDVVAETKNFYQSNYQVFCTVKKDLSDLKDSLYVFWGNTHQKMAALFNILTAPLYSSMPLYQSKFELRGSVRDMVKMLSTKDTELINLQAGICEIELLLGFHFNELVEQRSYAISIYNSYIESLNEQVAIWNVHRHNLSIDIALNSYQANLLWKEHLLYWEEKTKAVHLVIDFYKKYSAHAFISTLSNFDSLIVQQSENNQKAFNRINKNRKACYGNINENEKFLRRKGRLNSNLISQFINNAVHVVRGSEKGGDAYFNKKKQSMREIIEQLKKEGAAESACGMPDPDDEEDFKKKHPHGKYEENPKHHKYSKGNISKPPRDGQAALDSSVPVGGNSTQRIAVQDGNLIILKEHISGCYHGYIIDIDGFRKIGDMVKNALKRHGLDKQIIGWKIKK